MRMRALRHAVAAAALAIGLLAAPAPANASYLAELSIEDRTDAAAYIVEGEVLEVWTELGAGGTVWTRARVRVDEQLKGDDLPKEVVIDSLGGRHGDLTMRVVGAAVFSEGEKLFVFLDELGSGRLVPIGKFQGKFTIRRASGDARQHVMNWHARRVDDFDHRFLPHPAPAERIYLDDVRDSVAVRLASGELGVVPGVPTAEMERRNTPARRRVD
ncbi:MAG: hypothetical protein ACI8PZ_000342 [Myxococcota bacterium]|jgi:hypothetical protein